MELRDYQLDIANRGVEILRQYKILYLSMQVRTGKTITSLYIAQLYEAKNVLFVTKKKVIEDIEAQSKGLGIRFKLTITNYENLHNLSGGNYDLLILDESHCNGAFPTPNQRTKLLKKIAHGLPIIYLSGTPSPESYSQLYHQFWVSSYSPFTAYKTFYKWANDFVTVKKKYIYNRAINDYSGADSARIEKETSHLFISFSQEQAGFTEFVDEETLTVKMSPATYKIADTLLKHRIVKNKTGDLIIADTAVKMQQKLHQIYSGTCITEDRTTVTFDHSKAEYIKNNFADQKKGIFYKYIAEGEVLRQHFNWTTSPEEFNNSTDKVFISQIQSGREGINIATADCLIMYNIDFSAVSYFQARARLQTKDRLKKAKVYWLFSEGGIEQKIFQAVNNKLDYTLKYFIKDYKI